MANSFLRPVNVSEATKRATFVLSRCTLRDDAIRTAVCTEALKTTSQELQHEQEAKFVGNERIEARRRSIITHGKVTGCIGQLMIELPSGRTARGSGHLLRWNGHVIVLTCAHNFVQTTSIEGELIPIKSAFFYKAREGEKSYHCKFELERIMYHPKYSKYFIPLYGYDIAIARIRCSSIVAQDGSKLTETDILGEADSLLVDSKVVEDVMSIGPKSRLLVIGYPSEMKCFQYGMAGPALDVSVSETSEGVIIRYDRIDTTHGQSGSPVYLFADNGELHLAGVHVAGFEGDSCNAATALTSEKIEWLDEAVAYIFSERYILENCRSAGPLHLSIGEPGLDVTEDVPAHNRPTGCGTLIVMGPMQDRTWGVGVQPFRELQLLTTAPTQQPHPTGVSCSSWSIGCTAASKTLYIVDGKTVLEARREGYRVMPPLTRGRWNGPGVFVLDERLFLVGGYGNVEGVLRSMESLYMGTWTSEAAELPHGLAWTACTVVDDTVYIAGGYDDTDTILANVYTWRRDAPAWRPCAPMSQKRYEHRLVTIRGNVYALGGRANLHIESYIGMLNCMERYLPIEDTWEIMPEMPRARTQMSVVSHNDFILVLGECDMEGWRGDESGEVTGNVDVYDTSTLQWSLVRSSLGAGFKFILAAAVVDNADE